jgi:UPF0755 protein
MRGRPLRRALLLGLLGLALGALGLYLWLRAPYQGFAGPSVTVEFRIGTSTREIFEELERRGVVREHALAELYYRLFYFQPLRAGEYQFTGPETIDRVIGKLISGEVVRHAVVVREGLTDEETFDLFLQQRIGTRAGFERAETEVDLLPWATDEYRSLEGFLFPSTYLVTRSTSTRQIVSRMVDNFRSHFTPEMIRKAAAMDLTVRDVVILASFVEKETSLPSERPHVASVYLNRLAAGMRLQCDPTVIYALQKAGKWTGRLRRSDLDFDSPYNTYLHEGLPPGPICNPGAASLRAVVEPLETKDLYFVARGDGGHYFSRTYRDHLLMIAKSREARGEAAGESR